MYPFSQAVGRNMEFNFHKFLNRALSSLRTRDCLKKKWKARKELKKSLALPIEELKEETKAEAIDA